MIGHKPLQSESVRAMCSSGAASHEGRGLQCGAAGITPGHYDAATFERLETVGEGLRLLGIDPLFST